MRTYVTAIGTGVASSEILLHDLSTLLVAHEPQIERYFDISFLSQGQRIRVNSLFLSVCATFQL